MQLFYQEFFITKKSNYTTISFCARNYHSTPTTGHIYHHSMSAFKQHATIWIDGIVAVGEQKKLNYSY